MHNSENVNSGIVVRVISSHANKACALAAQTHASLASLGVIGGFMNVFISSVVRNFESYRAAAKKAVTLLGHVPVMCEDFGARPYSSQEACMTEVEQADVVVLVLGADFGFRTASGESVTQQEFRRARAADKPILAFLHDVDVEGLQQVVRRNLRNNFRFGTPTVGGVAETTKHGSSWPSSLSLLAPAVCVPSTRSMNRIS